MKISNLPKNYKKIYTKQTSTAATNKLLSASLYQFWAQ